MNSDPSTEILIVEDNLADAFELKQSVEKMGFSPPILAYNLETAHDIIMRQNPGIVICDLFLNNKPGGLDLLHEFSNRSGKFILVTDSVDGSYYEDAKTMGVGGHLIKPFHYLTLRSVIDRILNVPIPPTKYQKSYLFMRVAKNKQIRVDFSDILYLYSERNYMFVKTMEKLYTIKRSLIKMHEELDQRFVRVHNSYIINTDHLKSVAPLTVLIHKDILPLGRAYRKNLTNIIKSTRHSEVA